MKCVVRNAKSVNASASAYASLYECTVCCARPGAEWTQIVPVRCRGGGIEVCVVGCRLEKEGEGSFWPVGEPIYGSSSRALVLLIVTFTHTRCSIDGQSSNPLNSVPKGNMNKSGGDNWHSASTSY